MTFKVTLSGQNNYSVKKESISDVKATLIYRMPQNLSELQDVELSGNTTSIDTYVLSYDAATQKWKDVNPDQVLSDAATEPVSPGIPDDFEDALEISFDAGGF